MFISTFQRQLKKLHTYFAMGQYDSIFCAKQDLDRCATLRSTSLPGVFFLLVLFDLERDRNDCKHVGQIISEGASVLLTRMKK
ncbi:hypothetical protein T07_11572 [Trichinella nelsoni]|uniref:Uncharacterized protein n=1 Tax=Trichinella nelsoni TaxID=6336 RepID=A0A0V0SMV3_9BILA|nr:hypothetical protein T07_11572 [Trichinella nelsoni]